MSQCYHCAQEIQELVEKDIKGVTRPFCCHGCASVCEIIYESGLDSFYKLSPNTERPKATSAEHAQKNEYYDYDEVQSDFVDSLGRERNITLMSESIHCAACIWLIEHSLAKLDGILNASVNFTNKQIKIRWDNEQIQLSEILQYLNSIGYESRPYDAEESEQAYRKANRDLLYRLGFAGFTMMNAMWFAVALYAGAYEDESYRQYFYWFSFGLATITLGYSAQPFFKGAWNSLKAKSVGMDVSISLGLLVTYFYSTWILFNPEAGKPFFVIAMDLVFLLLIGRYLEAISKNRALDATRRLMELQPKMARKIVDGVEAMVPVSTLLRGELVLVKPGDKFPIDGEIIDGEAQVNESMLTGESREIFKQIGDQVSAGTINLDGSLTIKVEATLADSRLGKVIQLVEDAQGSKATIQCTAEKIMPWFVTVTISLAVLAFVYWLFNGSLEIAIMAGTTVLIITCPCALGLATPMAMAVAAGVSARNGILVKNSVVLEMLNEIDHFVFDKTGTLTTGKMKLVDYQLQPGLVAEDVLAKLAKLEAQSEHSLANSIVDYAEENIENWREKTADIADFTAFPGRGVEAKIGEQQIAAGTAKWLFEHYAIANDAQPDLVAELLNQADAQAELGRTSVWIALDGQIVGAVFIEDEIRADAKELIEKLKARGKQVSILSGDREIVAKAVAKQLGEIEVIAEVLPADKSNVVRDLQAKGLKVAMVGDGVNDAPALARATVGFALGGGTDVSMDSADIVLLNNELLAIDTALDLSTRTLKTIKQNIAMSIGYNLTMVPLAMAAVLTPLIASITMPLSSLLVIFNAMRIRKFYKNR